MSHLMTIMTGIVLPVFGVLIIGYAAARMRWFDAQSARGLSLFVFNFALPALLFRATARAELPANIPWGYLASYFLGAGGVYALGMVWARIRGRRRLNQKALFGFTACFSNMVLLGIPLILTALGDAAMLPLFILVSVHGMIWFTTTTILMEIGRQEGTALRGLPMQTLKGLATNPILLGLIAGVSWNLLDLGIVESVGKVLDSLGSAATPCALFAMGATLAQYRIAGSIPAATGLVTLKLIVQPAFVFALSHWVFNIPPAWSTVAVLLAALPAGVNPYLFAQRYEVEIPAAVTSVMLGTALSMFSFSGLLWLLGVG